MSQFEQEKQQYIDKLESQSELINHIDEHNRRVKLFTFDQMERLGELKETNQQLLHKLKTGEFEIAIVGLEKAGKSTFANALIENNVLPSAAERCTFTSTRLTSGNDRAKAEFYSKSEFNEIFQGLLKELGFPNAETTSYETLSLKAFETFFEGLQESDPRLYRDHYGTTFKEICDIINYRKGLILDAPPRLFSGAELESAEFKEFITGKKSKTQDVEEVDTSKPRSIKSLEIESSKLQNMPTAIIYDVPGFDSPTRIHRRQTEERLKQADAIILVTNVGTQPSIQGTSLDVLKNIDDDGIKLGDKLFVFGNQLDRANTRDDAQNNPKTLKSDVKKHDIGHVERVIVGSALKHLVNKQLVHVPDYEDRYDIPANIDTIFNALQDYYRTDRFENLKSKYDKNQSDLKKLFKLVIESNPEHQQELNEGSQRDLISREKQRTILNALDDALTTYIEQARQVILEEEKLTERFKDEVDKEEYFHHIDEDVFQDARIRHTRTTDKEDIPFNKINSEIRKDKYEKLLKDNEHIIDRTVVELDKEWYGKLQDCFVKAVLIAPLSLSDREEIEKLTKALIDNITGGISKNNEKFAHLINRFARNVYDVLIEHPLYDSDRNSLYDNRRAEFNYLDNYYNNGEGANGELISMILTQNPKDLVGNVRQDYNKHAQIINSIMNGVGSSFLKSNPTLDVAWKGVQEVIKSRRLSIDNIHAQDVIRDGDRKEYSKEGVILEINTDIDNLKEILKTAVVKAIKLDYAFFTSVDLQVKKLQDSLKNRTNDPANQRYFDEYISQVVNIFMRPMIDEIQERIETRKLEIEFLDKMKTYL